MTRYRVCWEHSEKTTQASTYYGELEIPDGVASRDYYLRRHRREVDWKEDYGENGDDFETDDDFEVLEEVPNEPEPDPVKGVPEDFGLAQGALLTVAGETPTEPKAGA